MLPKLRQEDRFKASLCYAMRPCLQATINFIYIYM